MIGRAAAAILILAAGVVSADGESNPYPRTLVEVRATVRMLAARKGPGASMENEYLARLRQYRYLCGVPYEDLSWDAKYAKLAHHAALLCSKLNQLTHTPSRPPGVTDEQYELGRRGAGESNLFTGVTDPAACVDGWMDDSDPSNIDRVGHRRWCLNPAMGKSAFGAVGNYAAMYAFDRSNRSVPDWDFVAYPARGYMPVPFFGGRHAWSVSPNMKKYGAVVPSQVKVTIQPLAPGKLQPVGAPLKLDYCKVDAGGFGTGPAIIFRPAAFTPLNDSVYQVEIAGLSAPIKYVVHFASLTRVSGPEATAVYTKFFKDRHAAVQDLADKVDQLEGLVELLESEFAGQIEPASRTAMQKHFQELLKDPAVKREHDAAQRHRQMVVLEQKAGKSRNQLTQVALAYGELGAAYRETRAGKRAALDFERLKGQLE